MATTDSDHTLPVAENLMGRHFEATAPDHKWVADITYIATQEGWLYLAVVMDLFSRRIVGWATSDSLQAGLVLGAMQMALDFRDPGPGLLDHSDRVVPPNHVNQRQVERFPVRGRCFSA